MIRHQAGAFMYGVCSLLLCCISLFPRFGVELGYCGFWRCCCFALTLANFELDLFLVDVVVDSLYKLRTGIVFVDCGPDYG